MTKVTAFNAVVNQNQDNMKNWFVWVSNKQTKLPERPCKPAVPDSAWNFLSYYGATDITNFSAEQKTNKEAMLKSLSSTSPVVADTLRSGLLQASTDDTLTTWAADNDGNAVGHVFGKYG